jgi:hypothetical protein
MDRCISRRRFLAQASAVTAAGAFAQGAATSRLLAGAAKRRVTPPLQVPFLTSSGNATNAPFQAVNDDLFARALVLDDGSRAIAVLAVDAIGYDNAVLGAERHFTNELRQRVAAQTGIPAKGLMLVATHTHQAPETIGLTPFRDVAGVTEWLERHLDELAATVIDAWRNRNEVRAFAGVTKVAGLARYRRIVLKDGTISRNGPLPPAEKIAVPWKLD